MEIKEMPKENLGDIFHGDGEQYKSMNDGLYEMLKHHIPNIAREEFEEALNTINEALPTIAAQINNLIDLLCTVMGSFTYADLGLKELTEFVGNIRYDYPLPPKEYARKYIKRYRSHYIGYYQIGRQQTVPNRVNIHVPCYWKR